MITSRTKAILPVHVFGYPAAMEAIRKIAKKHKLSVIEDACEAIGAKIEGKAAGLWGDCSVFAFYPNKQMTTGEGGMVVTNDDKIAELVASLRNQGRDEGMAWLSHSRLGYNYRLSDINCALGIAQLNRISEILEKRAKVADLYGKHLSDIEEIRLPPQGKNGLVRSWFVYVIRLDQKFNSVQRDEIIKHLREKGIGCNIYFPAIHLQKLYLDRFGFKPGDFPITESVSQRTIALPFFNNLKEEAVVYIKQALKEALKKAAKRG
jgi:perosamine synthetase